MALLFLFSGVFKIPKHSINLYVLLVGLRFMAVGGINVLITTLAFRQYGRQSSIAKRILRYFVGFLFIFLLYAGTDPLEFRVLALPGQWSIAQRWTNILVQSILNYIIVLILEGFILLRLQKSDMEIENSRLRAANMESVNLLLKQQIHPHFLFNALSMMKSLYKTDSQAGEAYLSHLVSFLRASLASPASGKGRLADEIKLCRDYLEMQHVRFQNALSCDIDIPDTVLHNGSLPSFALQSLIENAIKHNEVSNAAPLVIRVFYRDGRILTENNFQPRRLKDHSSGKGLINLIERYKILSGDEVIIRQDRHNFSVSIKVLNNENCDHRG